MTFDVCYCSIIINYQLVVESTTASIRRLSLVIQDTRINPYISRSNSVLFKFGSFNETPSLINAFVRSESVMFPACFIFS